MKIFLCLFKRDQNVRNENKKFRYFIYTVNQWQNYIAMCFAWRNEAFYYYFLTRLRLDFATEIKLTAYVGLIMLECYFKTESLPTSTKLTMMVSKNCANVSVSCIFKIVVKKE